MLLNWLFPVLCLLAASTPAAAVATETSNSSAGVAEEKLLFKKPPPPNQPPSEEEEPQFEVFEVLRGVEVLLPNAQLIFTAKSIHTKSPSNEAPASCARTGCTQGNGMGETSYAVSHLDTVTVMRDDGTDIEIKEEEGKVTVTVRNGPPSNGVKRATYRIMGFPSLAGNSSQPSSVVEMVESGGDNHLAEETLELHKLLPGEEKFELKVLRGVVVVVLPDGAGEVTFTSEKILIMGLGSITPVECSRSENPKTNVLRDQSHSVSHGDSVAVMRDDGTDIVIREKHGEVKITVRHGAPSSAQMRASQYASNPPPPEEQVEDATSGISQHDQPSEASDGVRTPQSGSTSGRSSPRPPPTPSEATHLAEIPVTQPTESRPGTPLSRQSSSTQHHQHPTHAAVAAETAVQSQQQPEEPPVPSWDGRTRKERKVPDADDIMVLFPAEGGGAVVELGLPPHSRVGYVTFSNGEPMCIIGKKGNESTMPAHAPSILIEHLADNSKVMRFSNSLPGFEREVDTIKVDRNDGITIKVTSGCVKLRQSRRGEAAKHILNGLLGSIGLEEVACDHIDLTYIRVNSPSLKTDLDSRVCAIVTAIQSLIGERYVPGGAGGGGIVGSGSPPQASPGQEGRLFGIERWEILFPTTVRLEFYQRRKRQWPIPEDQVPWEVWELQMDVVRAINNEDFYRMREFVGESLAERLLSISELINRPQYLPEMPARADLAYVFDVRHPDCNPYLYRVEWEPPTGTVGGGPTSHRSESPIALPSSASSSSSGFMRKLIRDTLSFSMG